MQGSGVSSACRPTINAAVAKYVGIPYKHGGRGADGLDCLGLIVAFLGEFGVEIPDGDGEVIQPDWWIHDPRRYLRGLVQHGEAVEGSLRALDLVYFSMHDNVVTHGGVMVDAGRFIHVLEHRRVMVTRLGSWWRRRMAGARRFV